MENYKRDVRPRPRAVLASDRRLPSHFLPIGTVQVRKPGCGIWPLHIVRVEGKLRLRNPFDGVTYASVEIEGYLALVEAGPIIPKNSRLFAGATLVLVPTSSHWLEELRAEGYPVELLPNQPEAAVTKRGAA